MDDIWVNRITIETVRVQDIGNQLHPKYDVYFQNLDRDKVQEQRLGLQEIVFRLQNLAVK